MSVEPKSFLYEHDEATGVATLTLNRPERLNALTFEIYRELSATFRALDTEPGVRAIILTGKGRAFCTGGDVEDIIGALLGKPIEDLLAFTRTTCELILSIRECRRPVVAALNGTVAGAGAVIAAAADFRVASSTAKIAFLFTKVGLTGADMGAGWLLPRLVGEAQARRLLMLGDFMSASEAQSIGLYTSVFEPEQAMAAARALALRLASGPSFALGVTKQALNREAALDLRAALDNEAELQAICMQSPNFAEAHRAFVEKRPPVFE
ncbi:MAG: enoyl-CoA hydratase family protein [Vicinamibacteria bacterium]